MACVDVVRVDPIRAMQREAVSILQAVMGRANIRPMPDGEIQFTVDMDERLLDRLCVWGADAEDLEDDGEAGFRERQPPQSGSPLPAVFSAALLISSPGLSEIAKLQPLPPELVAQAERILG